MASNTTATVSNDDHILYEEDGGIGLITLNRPAARNALTFAMYDRVAELCSNSGKAGLRALIITGAGGRAFAAGTDIAAFRDFSTPEHALHYEHHMDEVMGGIETCAVPTIAAISGACTGGGAGIACCCDLRIASSDLKFGFPIARTLGNCLSVATLSRLTTLLGAGRTRELLFTARLIGAQEAFDTGLIVEIADDDAAVQAKARALAEQLAGHAPLTLRATKEALRRMRQKQAEIDDDDLIALCYSSQDFREGLESFLAKRPPDWQGR